jgi:hypothetical protein
MNAVITAQEYPRPGVAHSPTIGTERRKINPLTGTGFEIGSGFVRRFVTKPDILWKIA